MQSFLLATDMGSIVTRKLGPFNSDCDTVFRNIFLIPDLLVAILLKQHAFSHLITSFSAHTVQCVETMVRSDVKHSYFLRF